MTNDHLPNAAADEGLDAAGVKAVLRRLQKLMEDNRERLIALDRLLGDGDLGLTMAAGFTQAAEQIGGLSEVLPGTLLARAGATIANAAPSTLGTLIATGFMRGGRAVGEARIMATPQAAAFFRAMTDGIMQRGKTQVGNKTIVDALHPAAAALERAAAEGCPLRDAMESAWQAAREGALAATALQARHGRAAYFQEQSIGQEDGGSAVGALILQGFRDVSTAGWG